MKEPSETSMPISGGIPLTPRDFDILDSQKEVESPSLVPEEFVRYVTDEMHSPNALKLFLKLAPEIKEKSDLDFFIEKIVSLPSISEDDKKRLVSILSPEIARPAEENTELLHALPDQATILYGHTRQSMVGIPHDQSVERSKSVAESKLESVSEITEFEVNGVIFKKGQIVKAKTDNGVVADGWKITRCPDMLGDKVFIFNEKLNEFKTVTPEEIFDCMNFVVSENNTEQQDNLFETEQFIVDGQQFRLHQPVAVLHNGVYGNGWYISGCPEGRNGFVRVRNDGTDEQDMVLIDEFLGWQKSGLETEKRENTSLNENNVDEAVQSGVQNQVETLEKQEAQQTAETREVVTGHIHAVEPSSAPLEAMIEAGLHNVPNEEQVFGHIESEISETRLKYAELLTAWKKKHREHKWKITKIFNDLGVERQVPESVKTPELIEAEKAYTEAKKKKAQFIISKGETIEKRKTQVKDEVGVMREKVEEIKHSVNENLIEQAEKEYAMLHKKMMEMMPSSEKSRLSKAFENWNKFPLWQRVVFTSALLGIGGIAFGGVGFTGAAAYAGARAARSYVGTFTGMGAGKIVDGVFKKRNEGRHEDVMETYVEGLNFDDLEPNFEKKEKEMLAALESHDRKRMRQQRIYKPGTVIAVAGATNVGLGMSMSHVAPGAIPHELGIFENIKHKLWPGGKVAPEGVVKPVAPKVSADTQKPSAMNAPVHGTPDQIQKTVIPSAPGTAPAVVAEQVKPVEVELSSQGFIQTFHDMKAKLIEQYGSADKVPDQYKVFVKTPSSQLAQEFGFYDAKHNLSGMGLKGEHLSLDSKGVHLEDATGKVKMNLGTDDGHTFADQGGKMIKTKPTVVVETPTEAAMRVKGLKFGQFLKDQETAAHGHVAEQLGGDETASLDHVSRPLGTDNYGDQEYVAPSPHDVHVPDAPTLDSVSHPAEMVATSETLTTGPDSFVKLVDTATLEKVMHSVPSSLGVEFNHGSLNLEMVNAHDGQHLFINGIGGNGLDKSFEIAHGIELFPKGPKVLTLNTILQDSKFTAMHEIYSKAFDYTVNLKEFGKNVTTLPFEGGKIHVIHGIGNNPADVKVLLNGQEIAHGSIADGHSTVHMTEGIPVHKHWWEAHTVYDQAFEKAQSTLKQLQKLPKVA